MGPPMSVLSPIKWLILVLVAVFIFPALVAAQTSESDQPADISQDQDLFESLFEIGKKRRDKLEAEAEETLTIPETHLPMSQSFPLMDEEVDDRDEVQATSKQPRHSEPHTAHQDAETYTQDLPTPLSIPDDELSNAKMDDEEDKADESVDPCAQDRMGVDPNQSSSGGSGVWDDAIHYSTGIRCYSCGEVDGHGNVIKACPPIEGSIKDWVHKNKIRTFICPTGCLTVKDPKSSSRVAMMCYHIGVRKVGRRVLSDDKRKAHMNRCYYAGCNAETLDEFIGRSSAGKVTPLMSFMATAVLLASAADRILC